MAPETPTDLTVEKVAKDLAADIKPKLRGWLHASAIPLSLVGGMLLIVFATSTLGRVGGDLVDAILDRLIRGCRRCHEPPLSHCANVSYGTVGSAYSVGPPRPHMGMGPIVVPWFNGRVFAIGSTGCTRRACSTARTSSG